MLWEPWQDRRMFPERLMSGRQNPRALTMRGERGEHARMGTVSQRGLPGPAGVAMTANGQGASFRR